MTCNAVAENVPAADPTKNTALVAGASGFIGG
jgi:hypothetical protein